MRKMYDYMCDPCGHMFEALVEADAEVTCPACSESPATKRLSGGHLFTVIKATSNTSKKYKAGFVHKYQKRDAEKISVQVPAAPTTP